ncbi:Flp family type IVb pilin [Desulfofalx alkaliphila]|uniref:Flp family type IVb pilin n=1 Tax=Desulfofalx alkaliphila TaxID=105483 RepID=UPI0004E24DF8|nr:hypothetical protein [Desulfofalx alkaliphila]
MLKRLLVKMQSERGQGLAEYALLLGIVAVAAITALASLSDGIEVVGNTIATVLENLAGDINRD